MWIRTADGQLVNSAWVKRIYAEDEDDIFKVTAEMNDGCDVILSFSESAKSAMQNIDFVHKSLTQGIPVCKLYSDVKERT